MNIVILYTPLRLLQNSASRFKAFRGREVYMIYKKLRRLLAVKDYASTATYVAHTWDDNSEGIIFPLFFMCIIIYDKITDSRKIWRDPMLVLNM